MGRIVPVIQYPQIVYGRPDDSLFTSVVSNKFRFSDSLAYANGNLQDHPPWAYSFATCATLIGFINGGGFLMQGDTVNNDWSVIRVAGKCPVRRKWLVQVQHTGFGSTNVFRGGFGLASSTSLTSFTLTKWFGPCIRRIVNAGAINVTEGQFSQGPCVTGDTNTVSASNPGVNAIYAMRVVPLGATTYTVQYFINSVLLLTTTVDGGVGTVGLVPAFSCSGFAGGGGAMLFNNVLVREL